MDGPKSLQYDEHGTVPLGTYEAEDPEGTEITWQIEDTDAEHFRISEDGVLTFVKSPDYENPIDFRLNNTYEIRLMAVDSGIPRASGRMQVRIEIMPVNEIGPITGDEELSVDENSIGAISQYEAEDPEGDTVAWSLSGADAALFEIDEEGTLSLNAALDFESPTSEAGTNNYSLNVVATDDNKRPVSQELPVAVEVTNVNEDPIIGIQEDPSVELIAGEGSTTLDLGEIFTDPDGDTLNYAIDLDEESDVASVTVEGDSLIITPLSVGTVTFEISAVDPAGSSATVVVNVGVASPPPPPSTPEPTPAPTPEPTPTPAPTSEPTPTPTATPTPTPEPTPTATPAPIPTPEVPPIETSAPVQTPAPTSTATLVPTALPTATPAPTPRATPTPLPSPSSTPTPTLVAIATPLPKPTATPAPISTPEPVQDGELEKAMIYEDRGIPGWGIALVVMGLLLATVGVVTFAYRRRLSSPGLR